MDDHHKKKFLITGGNGFIGSHLVKQLLSQGHKVVIIDNLSNSNIKSSLLDHVVDIPNCANKNISFYVADIRDKNIIDNIFKENPNIDTCIHLAAKISVSESIRNPTETMNVNFDGTCNMLEVSAKKNLKNFVFASSAAVYGNSRNLPLKEIEKCNPISPYGKSKLKGEEIVSKYSEKIPNTISLRFFNIYGIGQSLEYGGVITKFAESLTKAKSILIYGDGYQSRDFISIKDVVKAIIIASSADNYKKKITSHINYSNNIFNVGTGQPTKIIDIAKTMINLFKQKQIKNNPNNDEVITYKDYPPGDILHSYADVRKIEDIMGFRYEDNIINELKYIYKNYKIKD